MGRLKEFYHDRIDTEVTDGDEPTYDHEWLAEHLEGDKEQADKALMLLDGTESFAEPIAEPVTDYLLPRVSSEDFSESFSKFWQAIKRFVRYMFEALSNDNKLALAACRLVAFQAENLKMESRSALMNPSKQNGRIQIRSHITALSVFYRPPQKMGDVIAGLKNVERLLVEYYDYIDRTLTPGLNRLTMMIRGIDPKSDSFVADTKRVADELKRLSPATVMYKHLEGSNPKELLGPHLLGNQRLAAVGIPREPTLNEVTQSKLFLRHSELTPRKMPDTVYLPKFNLLNSDQCLDQVIRLANLVKNSLNGSATAKRERALNDLTSGVNRFVERAGELEDGRRQEKEEAYAIAQAVRATGTWMQNPYQGLTSSALRSMRGAVMVCRRNIE